MDLELGKKVAIVTGAATGIGACVARTLAQEGASVAIFDVNRTSGAATAESLNSEGFTAGFYFCDVANAESVELAVDGVRKELGNVDILVNNAGFVRDARITKMLEEDWDAVINTNLKGAWLCSKNCLSDMAEGGWGRIVNISSRAHWGNPGQSNYSSAKAGVVGLTRALAMEWGKKNITVNAIAPGLILTEMVKGLHNFDRVIEGAQARNTVPELGVPEDIAYTVSFLCSPKSKYINGELVHVTGGRFAG